MQFHVLNVCQFLPVITAVFTVFCHCPDKTLAKILFAVAVP